MQLSPTRDVFWFPCARLAILALALIASNASRSDAFSTVQQLRESGCGGRLPPTDPLRRSVLLDNAARDWATLPGVPPSEAARRIGYTAEIISGLHMSGSDSETDQMLRGTKCRAVYRKVFRDVGFYQEGAETWLILAAAYAKPSSSEAPLLSARILELINDARSRGTRCGKRTFAPTAPLTVSETLTGVAMRHAADMARHGYLEHTDLTGHTPAERVRAAGYRERLVGENIAYGPGSPDEVVRGWLDSPPHCENIMDPRFAQMGVAFAAGHASKPGLYWVQIFVEPGV